MVRGLVSRPPVVVVDAVAGAEQALARQQERPVLPKLVPVVVAVAVVVAVVVPRLETLPRIRPLAWYCAFRATQRRCCCRVCSWAGDRSLAARSSLMRRSEQGTW